MYKLPSVKYSIAYMFEVALPPPTSNVMNFITNLLEINPVNKNSKSAQLLTLKQQPFSVYFILGLAKTAKFDYFHKLMYHINICMLAFQLKSYTYFKIYYGGF